MYSQCKTCYTKSKTQKINICFNYCEAKHIKLICIFAAVSFLKHFFSLYCCSLSKHALCFGEISLINSSFAAQQKKCLFMRILMNITRFVEILNSSFNKLLNKKNYEK
jgi:hypothetical protein